LIGTWRGLQINKNYLVGEWRVVFTLQNVTVTRPDGQSFSGGAGTVGIYLYIDPQTGPLRGKKIQTLWQMLYGPASKELTWAWGVPGGKPPASFDAAMVEANHAEFVLASCLANKDPKVCNFDH